MRIAVVTPLFPTTKDPYRGQPVAETVRALSRLADVRVIVAHAVYPDLGATSSAAVAASIPAGNIIDISYPAVPVLSRPVNGATCASRIYNSVAKLRPDLVLNYWLYPEGYAAVKCAHALGIPAIVGARGSDLRRIRDPFTRKMIATTLREADSVLLVSSELREWMSRLGVSAEKSTVILNGCDREVFHYGTPDAAETAQDGVRPGERLILFVGRFAKGKGIVELLEAFAALAQQHGDLRLICVGNGPLGDYMARFTRRKGLAHRIGIPGPLAPREIASLLRAASLLCLPSYSEGCPNVVIEALSCGCPVVATDVGGIPELVGADCCVTVKARSTESVLDGMREALGRQWDRAAIGASSQRTWDDVARETLDACRAIVNSSTAPAVVRRERRLKVTLISSYFPQKNDPFRGHSAYHTLIHMQKMADIQVICPLASYPGARELPTEREYDSLPVQYVGYPAVPLLSRPINGYTCLRQLISRVRETRPDVILNYWLYPDGYSAVRAGRKLGVPAVVGSIGSDLRRITDPFTQHYVNRTLREASMVITVSEELQKRAIQAGAEPEKVTAILNGFDSTMFFPGDRDQARREAGYTHDGELILFVGSLLKTKGLAELVEAFRGVAADRPNARLAIVGEGIFRPILQSLIAESGLGERVFTLGRKSSTEVGAWMRAADVFCLPSYSEGCPNVVVEALACGVPIVVTDTGGTPELVRGPATGILIPPKDVRALRKALNDALTRHWDRSLIARAYTRNWEEVAHATLEVCYKAVEKSRVQRLL